MLYASFFFQIHRVQNLRLHFALGKTAAALNQTIGEGGFSMIDMRDDGKISDLLHSFLDIKRFAVKTKNKKH